MELGSKQIPVIERQSIQNRKEKKIDDKDLHYFQYCPKIKRIIAMSRLSGCLNLYNLDLEVKRKITPV